MNLVTAAVNPDEVAHLAYLNWQKDGCPPGRDQYYWLEAECQLKATKHLLAVEFAPASRTDGTADVVPSKSKKARKSSARPAAGR